MSRLTGNEAKSLIEAYNAVYASKEEVVQESAEDLNEAPMTAFQAAGGQARLDQLNRGRSPRAGRVTPAQLERKGQEILYKAGGGDAAVRQGPTRAQNVRGGGQVQVPTLSRQDIINRGAAAAAPKPAATAPVAAPKPAATAPVAAPKPAATAPAPTTKVAPAPAPRPSITSSLDDINRMKQASQIRQQTGAPTVTSDMIGSKSTAVPTTPRPQLSARAQALRAGGPAGGARERMLNQSFDMFDAILEHLVAEGYADTNKAALAIMANMSEEWKQDIVEAKYGTKAGRKALAKKIRKGENIGKKGPGTGFKAVAKAAKEGGARDPEAVAAAAMWKAHGGKKG